MSIEYNPSDDLNSIKEGLNSIIHTSEKLKKYITDIEEKIKNPLKTQDLIGGKVKGEENREILFKTNERVGQIIGGRRIEYGTIKDIVDDCILIEIVKSRPKVWVKASEVISFENYNGIFEKSTVCQIIRILRNIEVKNPKDNKKSS